MARRGNEILANYQQRIRDEKDAQTVTAGCAFCGLTAGTMTLAQQRTWRDTHLTEHHPEYKPAKRYGGRRSTYRAIGKRSLEENIEAARLTGASTWVNDPEPIEA